MIGQPTSHGWRTWHPPSASGHCIGGRSAQFMMGPTKIVGTAQQIHPAVQRLQAMSGMTASARQAREPLAHRAIEPFNERRIEDASAL